MLTTDAWGTAESIRAGRLTAVAVVQAALDRIAEHDGKVNAFTIVCADRALAAAAEVDTGLRCGPLAGVPISIKDHVWLSGLPATNGSRSLAHFVPDVSAVCVQRLIDSGAVVVGKTNNPEFCYRGITENDLFGATRNPHDLSRTAGGSSGGAAASVGAGMVPLAIGTDGGGSIRIPSAFCAAYGIKPTFGRIPKMPGFRGWPTLSVTGPIAGSVRDLALALDVMGGSSPLDPLSYPAPGIAARTAVIDPSLSGLRIAVSPDLGVCAIDADVRACFERLVAVVRSCGAEVIEFPALPGDPTGLWNSIALPEGYASEGALVEAHPELIGADAAAITLAGRNITAKQYLDAQEVRAAYIAEWGAVFSACDVLLTPTMPVTAFDIGRLAPPTVDGRPVPPSFDAWCALALPANLVGFPAVSIPIGVGDNGLPVGLQIMGPRWSDALVLRVAAAIDAL